MYKCINNSTGDIGHIEQLIGDFFPYSQKSLGFDKSVTIVFQSDPDNASKMLGKTAHYDPTNLEILLYTDNRHPKDIMRSLSHELVHHSQNCRGHFNSSEDTSQGYAQNNPHLRKMEREAYTKGNLIFRDFEDLIKTGKINIEIDVLIPGEPKMSLKEWKNDEINTKLMKKWGFLKESKGDPTHDPEEDWQTTGRRPPGALEEDELGGGCGDAGYRDDDELDEGAWTGAGKFQQMADDDDDLTAVPTATAYEIDKTKKAGTWGQKVRGGRPVPKAAGSDVSAKDRSAGSTSGLGHQRWEENKKISVREAKEITRRIIERIKKESN